MSRRDEARREYIVSALRGSGMYEEGARAYLAEYDAAQRAETLAEVADARDQYAARAVDRIVHLALTNVAAEHREMVAAPVLEEGDICDRATTGRAGKDGRLAESTQSDRLSFLRDAVRAAGGRWNSSRALHLFRDAGIPITTAACSGLLSRLCAEGVLCIADSIASDRYYFVPTGSTS